MITLDELRQRHAEIVTAREAAQRAFHDQDIGFAYTLGELERLIGIIRQRTNEEINSGLVAPSEGKGDAAP